MAGEEKKVKVFFSGIVFAEILNDAAKSIKMEEGILCGESNTQIVSNITDSREQNVQEEEIVVQSVISNAATLSFYDQFGKIYENNLASKLSNHDNRNNLIGWYKIRRFTSPHISLRERTVIKNLLHSTINRSTKLLFLVVTPIHDENKSTHSLAYKCFLCQKDRTPISIKANVLNLGEDSADQIKYKTRSRLIEQAGHSHFASTLREQESFRFFHADTGSSFHADNSFTVFHKTSQSMKSKQHEIAEVDEAIAECERELNTLTEV